MDVATTDLSQLMSYFFGAREFAVFMFSDPRIKEALDAFMRDVHGAGLARRTLPLHFGESDQHAILHLTSRFAIDRRVDLRQPEVFLGQRGLSSTRQHLFVPGGQVFRLLSLMYELLPSKEIISSQSGKEMKFVAPLRAGEFVNALYIGTAPFTLPPVQISA